MSSWYHDADAGSLIEKSEFSNLGCALTKKLLFSPAYTRGLKKWAAESRLCAYIIFFDCLRITMYAGQKKRSTFRKFSKSRKYYKIAQNERLDLNKIWVPKRSRFWSKSPLISGFLAASPPPDAWCTLPFELHSQSDYINLSFIMILRLIKL